jgi:uncharacterized protein YqjF (DUF2071 family)
VPVVRRSEGAAEGHLVVARLSLTKRRPFLTASWEHLLFLNYACPRELLAPLVPFGTELDAWEGRTLVSLVGLLFTDTRVRGIAIPFHRTFEEVNLRFYVRRIGPDGAARRAVVFIRELVPRAAIAAVARLVYNEPYLAVPMRRCIALESDRGGTVEYAWTYRGNPCCLAGTASGPAAALRPGSEAEFVTEHHFGYTRQRDGSTLEYEVEHPRWAVWERPAAASFEGAGEALYGTEFGRVLATPPQSAYIAVGSPVTVFAGQRLAAEASFEGSGT